MKKILLLHIMLIGLISHGQNKKSFLRDGNKAYSDSSYNDAEILYRKSLEKDQDYFKASYNLANSIYKQERFNESTPLFDALINNTKNKLELGNIYHNLGNSLVKENKINEAIEAYKNALRNNPSDKEARHNLILTLKNKREQDQKEKQNKDQQEEQNKDQQEEQNKDQQEKQNKDKNEKMSKEDAKKMLEAIQQKEQDLQEKLQKKKNKGKKIKILKDW